VHLLFFRHNVARKCTARSATSPFLHQELCGQ